MNVEQLADDVLLGVFECLDSVCTLRVFSHLNTRFDALLISYFQNHPLDLHGSSKDDFDLICRENLPSMVEHITGLRLSDDNDTPHQIDLLLSRGWTLNRFTRLRSITISNVSSNELISQLVKQCRQVPLLARFELSKCTLPYHRSTLQKLLNHLWSMPKLTDCKLDWTLLHLGSQVIVPTIRSASIESLSMSSFSLDFSQLLRLFRCTPRLRQLTTRIDDPSSVSRPFSSVISSLNIHVTPDSRPMMVHLLKHLPDLVYLRIVSEHLKDSGDQWQQLIEGHLPRLKRFELQMHYNIHRSSNVDDDIERVLHSYRSSFWLTDRQWFVRCCWDVSEGKAMIFLHTLPYHWDFFAFEPKYCYAYAKSTCPSNHRFNTYSRVKKLRYDYSPWAGSYFSDLRFLNVKHLEVTLPICDQFFSTLPRLDRLRSISVTDTADVVPDLVRSQLQTIIDRTPRLHSISIGSLSSDNVRHILLSIKSDSIRCIDLGRWHDPYSSRCFTANDIEGFLACPLASKCTMLSLVVDDRRQISRLIERMPQVRALKIEVESNSHVPPDHKQLFGWIIKGYYPGIIDETSPNEICRMWVR